MTPAALVRRRRTAIYSRNFNKLLDVHRRPGVGWWKCGHPRKGWQIPHKLGGWLYQIIADTTYLAFFDFGTEQSRGMWWRVKMSLRAHQTGNTAYYENTSKKGNPLDLCHRSHGLPRETCANCPKSRKRRTWRKRITSEDLYTNLFSWWQQWSILFHLPPVGITSGRYFPDCIRLGDERATRGEQIAMCRIMCGDVKWISWLYCYCSVNNLRQFCGWLLVGQGDYCGADPLIEAEFKLSKEEKPSLLLREAYLDS